MMMTQTGAMVDSRCASLCHRLSCGCFLFVMTVVQQTQVLAQTTADASPKDSDQSKNSQQTKEEADMMKGLAAGFGFFFGLLLLVCVVWCLCCGNVCNKTKGRDSRPKGKVAPSPPMSANVRTRATAAISSS